MVRAFDPLQEVGAESMSDLIVVEPLVSIERAVMLEVAKVEADVVPTMREPSRFWKYQWLSVIFPSERTSWGAVDEASCTSHRGVVVPIPSQPAVFEMAVVEADTSDVPLKKES